MTASEQRQLEIAVARRKGTTARGRIVQITFRVARRRRGIEWKTVSVDMEKGRRIVRHFRQGDDLRPHLPPGVRRIFEADQKTKLPAVGVVQGEL